MKCKSEDCNNERHLSDDPEVIIFSIPFTAIEIRIWNWNRKKAEEYCLECLQEIQPKIYSDDELDSIFRSGYDAGLDDAAWDVF